MTDKVQKILSEIATRKLCTMDEHMAFYNDKAKEDYRFLSEIKEIIMGVQEKPVSEDLEEAAMMHYKDVMERKIINGLETANMTSFKAGAKWQKEQMMAKAIRGRVSVNVESNYHRLIYGCWDMNDALENCNEGDRVKVIVIKED